MIFVASLTQSGFHSLFLPACLAGIPPKLETERRLMILPFFIAVWDVAGIFVINTIIRFVHTRSLAGSRKK